jgi:hypothetical protein
MKIQVKVIANSSQEKIEKTSEGLKIHLKEKAVKGKANKALIEMLAEHFGKKKSEVNIIKGQTSNKKIIEII